ncbi:hypothetical protein BD413DRAFT_718371 [Trametes elegans]|nr:hypothetical protein BD413DRAFT_718371 [Trametes elegans]
MSVTGESLFSNARILATISSHLDPGPLKPTYTSEPPADEGVRRERQRTLAQLAIVCRATSSPALDVLWKHIDSFHHVLFPLPAYDRQTLMFDDEITEADWIRFKAYGSRVRTLRMTDIGRVHASVWMILTRWSLHDPLLPNLVRLTDFTINAMSMCYTMLFTPTIRHLELTTDGSSESGAIRMVVRAAQATLSHVTSLVVDDQHSVSKGVPQNVAFWTLDQLESLVVKHKAPLTLAAMQALASVPRLQRLTVHVREVPVVDDRVTGFASLRNLVLEGTPNDIGNFIMATVLPSLVSFTGNAYDFCIDRQGVLRMQESFGSLPPTLRHFTASFRCTCNGEHFSDGEGLFRPLRALKALSSIALTYSLIKFTLEDRRLRAAVDAWPSLTAFEVITLKPTPLPHGDSHCIPMPMTIRVYSSDEDEDEDDTPPFNPLDHVPPTLPTLAAFARAHPSLERLALPSIDVDAVPDIASVPLLDHGLRTITVGELDKGVSLWDFALALDLLFPHLDFDSDMGTAAGARDRNGELQLLLRALQTGRTGAHRVQAGRLPPDAEIRFTRQGKYPESPPRARARLSRPRSMSRTTVDAEEYGSDHEPRYGGY